MKSINPRQLGAQTVIAAALIAGLSIGVLEPMKESVDAARQEVERSRDLAARAGEFAADAPAILKAERDIKAERQAIASLSEAATDTTRLNDLINALASECSVEIQRTQPREQPVAAPPSAEAAGDAPAAPVPSSAIAVTIDASGTFEAVSRFIDALETRTGFARLSSVRVAPGPDHADNVTVGIQSVHYAFKNPPQVPTAQAKEAQQ